jgi:OFA family oxalate/formate antiporter-like MFS transporter
VAVAQLAPIAKGFKIGDVPVGIPRAHPPLTFALTIESRRRGLTRPFFGWVSGKHRP